MKRLFGAVSLTIVVLLAGTSAYAQNLKFGHVNSDELIQTLPEFDSAQVKLNRFQQELTNELELLSVEYRNMNDKYEKEKNNYTEIVRKNKEQELVDAARRITDTQTEAQTNWQNRQNELFEPILVKVDKAIKDVGKENGFVYIFDVSKGILLYFDESKSTDIMPLAKAKLGIK